MKRSGVRRSGAARPMWDYLHAKTAIDNPLLHEDKPERIWAVDSHNWFQRTMLDCESARSKASPSSVPPTGQLEGYVESPYRREDNFEVAGYTLMDSSAKDRIDRVPFMWDFGFLLCRIHAWEDKSNKERGLEILESGKNPEKENFRNIADVWKNMILATKDGAQKKVDRPSWRVFLEACYQLAKIQTYSTSQPTQAFDLHISALPGLSCLILEIWASEIFKDLDEDRRSDFLKLIERREWGGSESGLLEWLALYPAQLFRTWLLLVDVLDLRDLASSIIGSHLGKREPNPNSLAVRHWYKTAWAVTQDQPVDDPLVPAGLPGHFSIRGDWFLSVAGGGRSDRLADQALDFLNTRSANYERLRLGLGLPVRRLVTDRLRTGIITLDRGDTRPEDKRRRVSRVRYENLIRLGGPVSAANSFLESNDFHWLWRSRLAHFPRHTRIWDDWLFQTIVWWNRIRDIDGGGWMNGFKRYDRIVSQEEDLNGLTVWKLFEGRCQHLAKELKSATLG